MRLWAARTTRKSPWSTQQEILYSNSRFFNRNSYESITGGGHKVLTYQTTRECLLGSLLNSIHIQRTKNKECPEEWVSGKVSRVCNPVTSLLKLHISQSSLKRWFRRAVEEFGKREAGTSVHYVLYSDIRVKLDIIKNLTSCFTFQNKASINEKNN